MSNFVVEMKGVPDAEVDNMVKLLKADPRYVSHKVISTGGGKNTIKITYKQ